MAGLLLSFGALPAASPARATPIFPESGYSLVYDLNIPTSSSAPTTYAVNNAASIVNGSFSRVGYLLQLQTATGSLKWVAVSMNAFTTAANQIGVPFYGSGELYNDVAVTDMDVESNVGGVVTGTGLTGGLLQFWNNCYLGSGGAHGTGIDVIQTASPACWGSMQIGDGRGTTVFAYNDFYNDYNRGASDLGIGNQPSGNPDWTFAANAGDYTIKELSIFVNGQTVSAAEPASAGLLLSALAALAAARRRSSRHAVAAGAQL
jgi:sialate O-acetylesterase